LQHAGVEYAFPFSGQSLCLFGAAPTPQAAGRLFAVGPDLAKILAVVALRKVVLGLIRLYLDANVTEIGEFKQVLRLCFLAGLQGTKAG
jgi:hypothetical protein